MSDYLYLIPVLPLLGAIVCGILHGLGGNNRNLVGGLLMSKLHRRIYPHRTPSTIRFSTCSREHSKTASSIRTERLPKRQDIAAKLYDCSGYAQAGMATGSESGL